MRRFTPPCRPISRKITRDPQLFEPLESRRLLTTVHVHLDDSIQAAVDAAAPGTTLLLDPGAYAQSVYVNKADLHIVGLHDRRGAGVTLTNPGGLTNGFKVGPAASHFQLKDVTVRGFETNGVLLVGVNGFELSGIVATDNGDYGVFPILSSNGVIDHCVAFGQADTGIYIGQSENVTISNCIAHDNVEGITVENASHIRVRNNLSYNNVAGIAVVILPQLTTKTSTDVDVSGNLVLSNNHANFADPTDIEAALPSGIGILVLGADNVTVQRNIAINNHFVGIAVGSTLLLGQIAGLPPAFFADIDPFADHVIVKDNIALFNGTTPIPGLGGADLIWDGTGADIHFSQNLFGTSQPAALP